jgi:hypothetical protein
MELTSQGEARKWLAQHAGHLPGPLPPDSLLAIIFHQVGCRA